MIGSPLPIFTKNQEVENSILSLTRSYMLIITGGILLAGGLIALGALVFTCLGVVFAP